MNTTTQRKTASQVLAIVGTIAVGIPLAAPLVLALIFLAFAGGLHLDFLMPGELFVVVIVGGVLLVIAAVLARRRRGLVGVLVALAAVLFATTNVLAAVTGIGSGETPAIGWPFAVVVATYAAYVASVVALFVVGIILCRETRTRHDGTIGPSGSTASA